MQRYFIYLSYDGTSYHGWQVQPNGNSVQEELQRALSTLLREKKEVVGARSFPTSARKAPIWGLSVAGWR